MLSIIIGLIVVVVFESVFLFTKVNKLSKLNEKYETSENTIKQLEIEVANNKDLVDKKENKIEQDVVLIKQLKNEIQKLQSNINILQDAEIKAENFRRTHETIISNLQRENNELHLLMKKTPSKKLCEDIEELKYEYETRIDELGKEISRLQDELQTQIVRKNKEIESLSQQLSNADSQMDYLIDKNKHLESTIRGSKPSSRISDLGKLLQLEKQKYNALQQNYTMLNSNYILIQDKYNDINKTCKLQENRIAELLKSIKKLQEKSFGSESPSGQPDQTELLVPADIDKVEVLFKDGDYVGQVHKLKNISDIEKYISESKYEKAERYKRYMKEYVEELDEAFDKISGDEDEISTNCSIKLANCFKNILVDKIIESSVVAVDENIFYKGLLGKIYDYMKENSIYSKKVEIGTKYEKMPFMDVIKVKTDDTSKDKSISKILFLPFYIKYTNESGSIKEKLLSKGKCIVLSVK